MNHRRLCWMLVIGVTSFMFIAPCVTPLEAKPKKPKDQQQSPQNTDGEDTIAGAVWEFASIHPETGEKKSFRFRVAEGVFYDGTDEIIGTSRLKKKNIAVLTFNDKSPAPGVYSVKLQRVGHWTGEHKSDEGKRSLRLTCIDR